MSPSARIDWAGLLRAGLGGLGLTPEAFWALTPQELRLMLGIEGTAAPLTRARLGELMAAFPDRDGDGEKADAGLERAGRPDRRAGDIAGRRAGRGGGV